MVRNESQLPIMQRDNEISRVVVDGRRADDGDRCTLVVVHERYGGGWASSAPRPPKLRLAAGRALHRWHLLWAAGPAGGGPLWVMVGTWWPGCSC